MCRAVGTSKEKWGGKEGLDDKDVDADVLKRMSSQAPLSVRVCGLLV